MNVFDWWSLLLCTISCRRPPPLCTLTRSFSRQERRIPFRSDAFRPPARALLSQKMFAEESTSEAERESTDESARAEDHGQVVADAKTLQQRLRYEFLEVLMVSQVAKDVTEKNTFNKDTLSKIRKVEARINKLFHDNLYTMDVKPDDFLALAQSYVHMAEIFSSWVWQGTLAERYSTHSLQLVCGMEETREAVLTAIKAYNCLGRVFNYNKDLKRSLSFYEKAFLLYMKYTGRRDSYPAPIDIIYFCGVMTAEFRSGRALERQHTLTLSNLVTVLRETDARLHEPAIVIYEHLLARKETQSIPLAVNCADWIRRVLAISKYLLARDRFAEARNHLGIAFYMLNKFYRTEYTNVDEEKYPRLKASMYEEYTNAARDVNEHAAHYGIAILRVSRDRLMEDETRPRRDTAKPVVRLTTVKRGRLPDSLIFPKLADAEFDFDAWITDKCVTNYNDANLVLSSVLKCLNETLLYESSTPSTHITTLRDMSRACRQFAFFELNESKLMTLHSWRLEILLRAETQLGALREKPILEKLVRLEQATIHTSMVNSHLDDLYVYKTKKLQTSPDINEHVSQAIALFQKCLDLRKDT